MDLPKSFQANSTKTTMVIGLFLIVIIPIVFLAGMNNIMDAQFAISMLIGLVVLDLLLRGESGYPKLLYLGVFSIVAGHRAIYLGTWTYLTPLTVILLVLFIFLIPKFLSRQTLVDFRVPSMLFLFEVWIVLRATISLLFTGDWDGILSWTIPFAVGYPTFFVIGFLITETLQVRTILRILLCVSCIMSIEGLIEILFPSITGFLPGLYYTNELTVVTTADGFTRLKFAFWGSTAAATIIVWGALIAYNVMLNDPSQTWRRIALLSLPVCVIAIYLSGQRAAWIGFFSGFLVLSLLPGQQSSTRYLILIVLLVAMTSILPGEFWNRLDTMSEFVSSGQIMDSSEQKRLDRWQWGIDTIRNKPFGAGYRLWATHNVFIEIGSKAGIFPLAFFTIFFLQLTKRILHPVIHRQMPQTADFGWLFMALWITWIVQFLVELALASSIFSAPHWILMAMGWYLPTIQAKEIEQVNRPAHYLLTHS